MTGAIPQPNPITTRPKRKIQMLSEKMNRVPTIIKISVANNPILLLRVII